MPNYDFHTIKLTLLGLHLTILDYISRMREERDFDEINLIMKN